MTEEATAPEAIEDLAIVIDEPKMIAAAMDSVNLLLAGKPDGVTDEKWEDTKRRNAEHLEIVRQRVDLNRADTAKFEKALAA